MKVNSLVAVMLAAGATLVTGSAALGASGTWTNANGGLWGDDGNWDSDIADGAGFTADFSSVDLDGGATVSLNTPRTIGNLIFGDAVPGTSGSWTLDNNSDDTNVLTLSGTTPTITVNAMGTNSVARIDAVIAGTQGMVKDGSGILTLAGENTYSGGTTISDGIIRVVHNQALGSGEVTVADGARLQLNNVNLGNTINLNGTSALLRNSGDSTLSGVVNLQSDATASMISSNNGRITFSGTLNLSSHRLTFKTTNGSPFEITGEITGTGGIFKDNDGTLTIFDDNTAAYSGTTTLGRGNLALGHDGALGSGTFEFKTNNDTSSRIRSDDTTARTIANPMVITAQSVGNANARHLFGTAGSGDLTFTGPITISGTRKLEVANTTEFAGDVGGTGGFIKQGAAGMLILSGTNNYEGITTVNAGTLLVHGANNGTGAVTVGAEGTLGGTGSIAADVSFADGSTFLALLDGSLDLGGLVTIGENVTIKVDEALTLPSYTVLTHGVGDLSGTFVVDSSISDLGYQVVYGADSVSLVVPEPSMLAFAGLGGVSLLLRRRRRCC